MKPEENIAQLQMIEQSMQQIIMQKRQFQSQLLEIESALGELKDSEVAYKIIGTIMVKSDPVKITKELEEKKEMLGLRIKTIEKQESNLKDKAEEMQKKIMEELKANKNGSQTSN